MPEGGWTREETIKSSSGIQHIVHHYVPVNPNAGPDQQPLSPSAIPGAVPTHVSGAGGGVASNVVVVAAPAGSAHAANGAGVPNGVPVPAGVGLRPELMDPHAAPEVVVNGAVRRGTLPPQQVRDSILICV